MLESGISIFQFLFLRTVPALNTTEFPRVRIRRRHERRKTNDDGDEICTSSTTTMLHVDEQQQDTGAVLVGSCVIHNVV